MGFQKKNIIISFLIANAHMVNHFNYSLHFNYSTTPPGSHYIYPTIQILTGAWIPQKALSPLKLMTLMLEVKF